jgi:anaerobic selenocysteine-containing dehydrogenase
VVEALEKLEFFVVIDVMQNSSMPWADVVVPVATMYECDHPFEVTGNWIMARNKVIEPLGDYKSDYEFWLDLGVRMGYGEDFWDGSIEKCMNYQLENFGMTMEELRAHPTGLLISLRAKWQSIILRSKRMGSIHCQNGWSRPRVQRLHRSS